MEISTNLLRISGNSYIASIIGFFFILMWPVTCDLRPATCDCDLWPAKETCLEIIISTTVPLKSTTRFREFASWVIGLLPRVYQHGNQYMAAHFWHVRIPQNELAFLHDLEAYHALESIQISFAEVHSYPIPSYLATTEAQTNAYETHFFVNGFI